MNDQHREAAHAPGAVLAPPSDAPDADRGSSRDASGGAGSASREPLSCARIMDAAVRYVDHNCLDELSMRRLGNELGVEAMSLYRYFPSKAALLDAVARRLLRDLDLPAPDSGADWESRVRAYGWSFRTIATAHPNLVPLLSRMSPDEPPIADIHHRMVGLWCEAGLPAAQAGSAQRAFQCYLSGSAQWHRSSRTGGGADGDFAFGLDVFLDGFRSRLPATGGAR